MTHRLHDPGRPRVPDVLPLAQAIYARTLSLSGCCLHITLDDDNVADDDVEFCARMALEQGHPDCLQLALALRRMSASQRSRVAKLS